MEQGKSNSKPTINDRSESRLAGFDSIDNRFSSIDSLKAIKSNQKDYLLRGKLSNEYTALLSVGPLWKGNIANVS